MLRNLRRAATRINGLRTRQCNLSTRTSVAFDDADGLAESTTQSLLKHHADAAKTVVPWFLNNMPPEYFNSVKEKTRTNHLRTILALHESGLAPEISLVNAQDHDVTFIRDASEASTAAMLVDMLDHLPDAETIGGPLSRIKIFTSLDDTLWLTQFKFGEQWQFDGESAADQVGRDRILAYAADLEAGKYRMSRGNRHPDFDAALHGAGALEAYMRLCNSHYVQRSSPRRFLVQRGLYARVAGTEGVAVHSERFSPSQYNPTPQEPLKRVETQVTWGGAHKRGDGDGADAPLRMLTIAGANVRPDAAVKSTAQYLLNWGLEIQRAHLDTVRDPANGDDGFVTMLRLLIKPAQPAGGNGNGNGSGGSQHAAGATGGKVQRELSLKQPSKADWRKIEEDVARLKWLDDRAVQLAERLAVDLFADGASGLDSEHGTALFPKELYAGCANGAPLAPLTSGQLHAETVIAMCNMLHGPMSKVDRFAYSRGRIFEVVQHPRNLPHALAVADLLLARFNPEAPLDDAAFEARVEEVRANVRDNVEGTDVRRLLHRMVDAAASVLRTNAYLPERYALCFRLSPAIMGVNEVIGTAEPFGVFFVQGRRFKGFHVRFRDIARGGLRVVVPVSGEQHQVESARAYNEAYSLAFAQQLKNKDIPEGGSKAVCLIDPPEEISTNPTYRYRLLRKSVKAFADSILDLVSTDEEVTSRLVDHYGTPELIYLGPDENVVPDDINWMSDRAVLRGYPVPAAFISSKPEAGFNHKEYGVTSEGVAVFLDVALHERGLKPREEPFTVKIAGGPDGDVAGNMMKILKREYGDNAKIVGVADGSGCAEDPAGLDTDELVRLFGEEAPIAEYRGALGADGALYTVDTAEGIRMRNTMHNRVHADVFVPAGGRPATIDERNYKHYLGEDGKTPSSPLVVEGANLFITPDARQALFEEGDVVIVKDSSANKCGVITSSYEILCSMMLDEEEFLAHKDALAEGVLGKLQEVARVEAELMFAEFRADPGVAPPLTSQRISNVITRAHDAVSDALAGASQGDVAELEDVLLAHLPTKLRELAGDRVMHRVPLPYQKQIISCLLGSKIVYKEGIAFVEGLSEAALAGIALRYLKEERKVEALVDKVRRADVELSEADREDIAALLSKGGVRAALLAKG